MKLTTLIFSILVAFTQTAMAFETQISNPLFSQISDFEIEHESYSNVDSGYVNLDLDKNVIRITLTEKSPCLKNEICIALAPETHVIELPITNVYSDWCGSETYVAELDSTPVDGLLEVVEMTDYSNIVCRIQVPFLTETHYRTFNLRTNQWTQSSFGGGKLFFLNKLSKNITSQM